jgi:predicted SAM-dependent methyltransferase
MKEHRRLHLGCGLTAPSGWLNVDGSLQATLAKYPRVRSLIGRLGLVPQTQVQIPWPTTVMRADLRKKLPFPDGAFDAVYSSHLLEHLYRAEALALLQESRRVLRPGGICRAVVPDLAMLIKGYVRDTAHAEADAGRAFCRGLLMRPETAPRAGLAYRLYQTLTDYHEHKWMYDAASLTWLFREAGFDQVALRIFRDSAIAGIEEVELPDRAEAGVGICVEAIRT